MHPRPTKTIAITLLSLIALLMPAAARADDWWQRDLAIPINRQMPSPAAAIRTEGAPQISPLASPLRRPVDPEFCEHYGYSDPDECAREWANYLAHLPY